MGFCLFFLNIYCSVFPHPCTARFSIRSDHSGKLSVFFFLLFNLETSFLVPFCPHAPVWTGCCLTSDPAGIPESSFVVILKIPLSPALDPSFFGFLVTFLDMLPYFGRDTSSSSWLRNDTQDIKFLSSCISDNLLIHFINSLAGYRILSHFTKNLEGFLISSSFYTYCLEGQYHSLINYS